MIVAKLKEILPFAISCLLLAVFFFVQISCIFKESGTYDEPLFVEAGLRFLKEKDFSFDPFNPPFARELIALPLVFNSKVIIDPFFFLPRMVVVIFSIGLALLVYFWSQFIYGQKAAIFSLIILLVTPEFLAHSHYANTDLISTFFAFLTFYFFIRLRRKPRLVAVDECEDLSASADFAPRRSKRRRYPVTQSPVPDGTGQSGTGSFIKFFLREKEVNLNLFLLFCVLLGLALAARTLNIFLVFIPLIIYWIFFFRKKLKPIFLVLGSLSALLVIWSTYFFTWEPILGYRNDPNRQAFEFIKKYPRLSFMLKQPVPLGSYISTIKNNFLYNQTNKFPKYAAFLGEFRESGPGYFVWFIFLIKTPIPLIIILAVCLLKRKPSEQETFLRFMLIFTLLIIIPLGTNLRIRYFLIIYPLLAVSAGNIIDDFWKKLFGKLAVIVLTLWLVYGTVRTYPHFLTYFNEFVGGRENGYKYVVDSNLDWGQGLPTLRKYLERKNIKNVQLAYFGSVEPSTYGISYLRIGEANLLAGEKTINLDFNKPMVISTSSWYYGGYYKEPELLDLKPAVLEGQFLLFNF